MPTLDEVLEQVREEGLTDELETQLREGMGTSKWQRETVDRLKARVAELEPRAKRADELERAPKARAAFEKAGLNYDELSKIERRSVESFTDFEDEEKVAAFIADNELPTREADADEEEQPSSGQIADHARAAGRQQGSTKATIGPKEAAEWPAEKWAKFEADHAELAEKVLSGEEVVAPA